MNSGNVLKPPNMSFPCYNLLIKVLDRNNRYSISLAQSHFLFSSNGKSGLYSKSLMGYSKFKIQKDNNQDINYSVTKNFPQSNIYDRPLFSNHRGNYIQQHEIPQYYHKSYSRVAQQTFG